MFLQEVLEPCKNFTPAWPHRYWLRFEDQAQALLALLPTHYAYVTTASYMNGRWVPYQRLLGSLRLSLCCISRYPLTTAIRYQLPFDTHINPIVRYYYPKRALQVVTLPFNGQQIQLGNTT